MVENSLTSSHSLHHCHNQICNDISLIPRHPATDGSDNSSTPKKHRRQYDDKIYVTMMDDE